MSQSLSHLLLKSRSNTFIYIAESHWVTGEGGVLLGLTHVCIDDINVIILNPPMFMLEIFRNDGEKFAGGV